MIEFRQSMEIIIIPLIAGFVDLINYYPNGDSPGFYGDGTEPFYITFSLFDYLIVFLLVKIAQIIEDIYFEGIYIVKNENDDNE